MWKPGNKCPSPLSNAPELPINKHKDEILYLVDSNPVIIVVGETGSGKTTQLPQYLYESGYKTVCCTQPRRMAAISISNFINQPHVGYAVRFQENCSDQTKIKFMTDGLLLREALFDPLFSKYSAIIVDEVHERSINTDLLLGLLKRVVKKRLDLKVVISSATADAELFSEYFHNAPIISVEGRIFPVTVWMREIDPVDYVKDSVDLCIKLHLTEKEGDVLVFLTGREEIEYACSIMNEFSDRLSPIGQAFTAIPLFSGCNEELVFKYTSHRKIIFSTNIAETSITIDGIRFVVDGGFVKGKVMDKFESLALSRISQSSAIQRSGRAGRVSGGVAYRLYSQQTFESMSLNSIPDIQKSNLTLLVLQLKALGIGNLLKFDFVTPLPPDLLARSLETLYSLDCIDLNGCITKIGEQVCEFPLSPLMSKCLVVSGLFHCSLDIASIAAMIDLNVFNDHFDPRLKVEEGDHISLLNAFKGFEQNPTSEWCKKFNVNYQSLLTATKVRKQIISILKRFQIPLETTKDPIAIQRCLCVGHISQAARIQPDGSFRTVKDGITAYCHPDSVLFRKAPRIVVFGNLLQTTKCFIKDLTLIEDDWLLEFGSKLYLKN